MRKDILTTPVYLHFYVLMAFAVCWGSLQHWKIIIIPRRCFRNSTVRMTRHPDTHFCTEFYITFLLAFWVRHTGEEGKKSLELKFCSGGKLATTDCDFWTIASMITGEWCDCCCCCAANPKVLLWKGESRRKAIFLYEKMCLLHLT